MREGRAASAALAGAVVTIVLVAGSRSALAAFIRPIEADLGLDRSVLSTAGALSVLTYGLAQPFLGVLATRFGARQVMIGGVVLTAVSGVGVAVASQPWQLYLFAGLTPGLAFAGASSVPGTVLLAGWFVARLGLATGIMSSAIPAGQSLFVPLAAGLIPTIGWRPSSVVLGLAATAIALPVLVLLVREPPPSSTATSAATPRPGLDIWLVGIGYLACGFSDDDRRRDGRLAGRPERVCSGLVRPGCAGLRGRHAGRRAGSAADPAGPCVATLGARARSSAACLSCPT